MNYRNEFELQKVVKALNDGNVDYMIFGNYAMKTYDSAKKVDALYVWVNPEKENLIKLDKALIEANILHGQINADKIVASSIENPVKAESISFAINTKTGLKTVFTNTPYGLKTSDFKAYYDKVETVTSPAFQSLDNDKIVLNGKLKHKQLNAEGLSKNARIAVKYGQYSQNDQILLQDTLEKQGFGNQLNLDKTPFADYNKAIDKLDFESVLENYGFSERADKTSKQWRVWQNEDAKLAVLNGQKGGVSVKFGFDLTGALSSRRSNSYRGELFDVVQLIDFMEGGNLRAKNEKVNSLMGDTNFLFKSENHRVTKPMRTIKLDDLNDKVVARLREVNLIEEHTLKPLDKTAIKILENRDVSEKIIKESIFHNQIIAGTRAFKDNPNSKKDYVTFPISNQNRQIISILQRRTGFKPDKENPTILKPINEKWFSDATRTGGLWKSNLYFESQKDIRNEKGEIIIPQGTLVNVSRNTGNNQDVQMVGKSEILSVSKEQLPNLKLVEANQIHIFEDALDAISYHQLVPTNDVKRLYLATSGQPTNPQSEHIKNILSYNLQAQLVINPDNDPPGYRFGINHLNIKHPRFDERYDVNVNVKAQIPLDVTAVKDTKDLEKSLPEDKRNLSKKYTNRLELEINAPFGEGHPYRNQKEAEKAINHKIEKLMKTINGEIDRKDLAEEKTELNNDIIGKIERSQVLLNLEGNGVVSKIDLSLPNDKEFLRKTINGVKDLINDQQMQPIYRVDALKYEKDFNELLANRKGRPVEHSDYSKKPKPIEKLDVSKVMIQMEASRIQFEKQQKEMATKMEKAGVGSFIKPVVKEKQETVTKPKVQQQQML